ncbi:MAG: acetate--CoA ligase family protein [Dehalococcoidia bacterium]
MPDPIASARAAGRTLLNEIESKDLLAAAGVPVTAARLATKASEAVEIADEIGYPVVLKVISADISHKSDIGGVELNLTKASEVRAAFRRIKDAAKAAAPKAKIEGVSVQKMAQPGTEVIIGMTTDAQFGPVMMFGLGGIMVEVLKDVAFRVVPLEAHDASGIIREIRGYPVLEGVRGQAGVDIAALEQLLLKVSAFAQAHPEVAEIDLNPVFAYPDGALAVDARVVLAPADQPAAARRAPVDQQRLHRVLNPSSVVVVGDKGPNYQWLTNQQEFPGPLWSVQVDENEIKGIEERGFKNFKSLADVPGDIDLLICAVPRQVVPRIVQDAVTRQIGGIAMFTAGFAETGEDLGIDLQNRIVGMANEVGMPIIGPNCMGIYNRRLGIRFNAEMQHAEGGSVSFMSQSGSHANNLTAEAQYAGLEVTRTISIGNAAILNEADYIEYLANDPDTKYIGIYIEGPRDGRRFFERLREVTKHKPVAIFKGGTTAHGASAARTHTTSLATPTVLWESMVRQAGAIPVVTRDDLVDAMIGLVKSPPAKGRRMALLAGSGGQSVAISDSAGRAGLDMPRLSDESYDRLKEFFNTIGGSYFNPFDMGGTIGGNSIRGSESNLQKILDILAEDPVLDAAIYEIQAGGLGGQRDPERLSRMLNTIDEWRDQKWRKPLLMVVNPGTNAESYNMVRTALIQRGYPVYPNFDRAARAYDRIERYYAYREGRA